MLGCVYTMPTNTNSEYDPEDPSLPGMSLREYIETSGISYSEFARRVPCSTSYPRMIAKNEAWPSFKMAKRIEALTDGIVPRTRWYPPEDHNNAG